ncbi:MAG TPA: RNA 2',3'-cyclic phosphodiesterase [Gemmatimonadaceae bacterium]
MRLFLAINLPRAEREAIVRATAPMRDAAPRVSWVTEERLHLTIKFLGEQPEAALAPLEHALRAALAAHAPVELRLGGLGAFPNLRAPKIVWMGVAHEPRLELVQHDVEYACAGLGYEIDGRAFRPHVTLARARERVSPRDARALADAARAVRYAATVEARTLDVMSSRLERSGARYERLAAIPLGPG